MNYSIKNSWYVLRVRSQAERLAYVGLKRKQFKVLNPTFQYLSIRKDRKKVLNIPIFKGYIFLHALLNSEKHLEILKTPGVVEILNSKSGPTPVPEDQIENVILLEKHVGDCFYGDTFQIGDPVFVREGPLTGLKGIVNRLDKNKLHIHVDAIPGTVMIDIEPHQIQLEKDAIYGLVSNR